MKNNKGFGVIGIILIIVGVLVVGGGAYYLGKNSKIDDNLPQNKGDDLENNYNNSKININPEITNIKELISGGDNSLGDPFWNYQPKWSPDGEKILISSYPTGIYVNYINNNEQKFLTNDGTGAGFRYNWSPDSKAIVYLSREFKNGQQNNIIKLIEIETGEIIELTQGVGSSMPYFTPTSEVVYSYKGTLIKRKWNGVSIGKEETITKNVPANVVIPSPKGNILVVENDEGIMSLNNNGDDRKIIVKNEKNSFAWGVKFSSDGNNILFSNNVGSESHLFVYSFKTEKTVDLGNGMDYDWLPNNKIVYNIGKDDGNIMIGSEIYVINADGTSKKQITYTKDKIEVGLAVSFDGKFIVYMDENKTGSMYIGDLKY